MKLRLRIGRLAGFSVAAIGLISGVAAAQMDVSSTYILVHGSFQTSAGWSEVAESLEADGNTVITVDLPGHGEDETPFQEITLETYRDAVIEVVEQQSQPVILVGHSFGGFTISAVAEAIPERIETLVYLAGYLPRNGESLTALAGQDRFSQIGSNLVINEMTLTATVPDAFVSVFCPECNAEQLETVTASQVPEPLIALNQPIALTEANFGTVEKVYILTAQDTIVSPQLQALMLANTPVNRVYAVDASHAAYFSVPEQIAEILTDR